VRKRLARIFYCAAASASHFRVAATRLAEKGGLVFPLAVFFFASVVLFQSGCGTCRPGGPRVKPHGEATVGGGSGGYSRSSAVGFDISNLFCKPAPEDEPEPEAGAEPESASAPEETERDGAEPPMQPL